MARYRDKGDSPLFFPGKVLADSAGERLIIADSTHHRIVVTDLAGNHLATAGTGQPGYEDGGFDKAQFDDPQGMAVQGDTLYVADRKNHVIRALDLKKKTVKTVAGNTASYPELGDNAISVAGLVVAPGTRNYQGWYRSANPSFCTPETFNLTNGLEVAWAP